MCSKRIEAMVVSDVCPTEDAILAFLEYLVDPMLPENSSLRDTSSQSQKQSVAKQVFFSDFLERVFDVLPF